MAGRTVRRAATARALVDAEVAEQRRQHASGASRRTELSPRVGAEQKRSVADGYAAADVALQRRSAFLRLQLADQQREVFGVIFLDSAHAVIAFEVLFEGTLAQTAVYPREVVKRALERNAAALILAHNHPSGVAKPSQADERLTQTLQQALALVDIRVLDHIIVDRSEAASFAERGLL